MKRRNFLTGAAAIAAAGAVAPAIKAQEKKAQPAKRMRYDDWNKLGYEAPKYKVSCLTNGPKNHFFGYYDMSPWSADESKMVGLESSFHDRLPTTEESAKIGLIDQKTGDFTPIAETLAWNLQQGTLIHWNPLNPNSEIIYNDRTGNHIHAQILNVNTGEKRALDRPINAVGTTGRYALSLTMGRLSRLRRVVGYAGAEDPNPTVAHPDNDGVFRIDLETGESKLIVSIKDVYEAAVGGFPQLKGNHMWFNHTVLSPNGQRFFFLARWREAGASRMDSAMFTANIDGSDLRQVVPFGSGTSHFGWRNNKEIVATFTKIGTSEMKHYLFTDGEDDYRILGDGMLIGNGHCSFNTDGSLMVTDRTEADRFSSSLWLYDIKADIGIQLSSHSPIRAQWLSRDTRCDFHPRWSPSGTRICYDAIDSATHTRQMHVVEFL